MNAEKKPNKIEIDSSDFKYILQVNQKAIEIYLNVEKQNEEILVNLNKLKEYSENAEKELDEISETGSDSVSKKTQQLELIKSIIAKLEKALESQKDNHTKAMENQKDNQIILNYLKTDLDSEIKPKLAEIDKNMFRLVAVLSTGVLGGLVSVGIKVYEMVHGK